MDIRGKYTATTAAVISESSQGTHRAMTLLLLSNAVLTTRSRRWLSGRACTSRHASVKRLWVRIPLSPPAGPSWHRYALTCLETERNLAAAYGSLALKVLYFLVWKHGDSLAILTVLPTINNGFPSYCRIGNFCVFKNFCPIAKIEHAIISLLNRLSIH